MRHAILTAIVLCSAAVASGAALRRFVVSASDAQDQAETLRAFDVTGPFWTPTSDHLDELERLLAAYLKVHWPSDRSPPHELSTYAFQYVGYTLRGVRVIFVKASCSDEAEPGLRISIVYDGGSCFFELTYDPTSKTFSDLSVNGEA